MRAVIQRVSSASVAVDGGIVGSIGRGLLVLVGVEHGDGPAEVQALVDKVATLRVFPTEAGHFEASVLDVGGSVLVVSQFTLPADLRRGRRPSFTRAEKPESAEPIVHAVVDAFRSRGLDTATGRFGAMMEVSLVNEGPATFVLDVNDGRVGRPSVGTPGVAEP